MMRDGIICVPGHVQYSQAGPFSVAFAGALNDLKRFPFHDASVTMLDKVGVPTEKLGDSTGKLNRLEV
jgi:hypothetical protein